MSATGLPAASPGSAYKLSNHPFLKKSFHDPQTNEPVATTAVAGAKESQPKKSHLFGVVMALWGSTLVLVLVLVAFPINKAYGPLHFRPDSAQTVYWGEVRQIQHGR